MVHVTRLVLDVLKPHKPNALEFSRLIAEPGGYRVNVAVLEIDENTETLRVEISGENIDFDAVQRAVSEAGASLHSIDEVDVQG